MFRTAKRTARFSATARPPEIQQSVVRVAVKVVDRLYSGHDMVEKRKEDSDTKVQF